MALDVYSPCPCGSGKKLKFCCHDLLPEMDRVIRLRENQPQAALVRLQKLQKLHPNNPWVIVNTASILLGERRPRVAKAILEQFHEQHPDHLTALALLATAALQSDGYEHSKKLIHRAFQKCATAAPHMISGLAMGIAALMSYTHRFMAARAHLALALRSTHEDRRGEVFRQLLEFDGNRNILYPFRSVHDLAEFTSDDEDLNKDAVRAGRLAAIGCYGPAARLFARIAEQEADSAAVWQNVGLCQAWDGDEPSAAQSLHLAARLHDDRLAAVECETIAQLLDQRHDEESLKVLGVKYNVKSVSRLLTLFSQHDRFARVARPPSSEEDSSAPDGHFRILDRVLPDDKPDDLTIDDIPNVLAEVLVFDADEDDPSEMQLVVRDAEQLDEIRDLLQEVAGDELVADESEDDEPQVVDLIPSDLARLKWDWHFPEETPPIRRTELEQEMWRRAVYEIWPQTPLIGLGGRSPQEAAGNDDEIVPLHAALYTLDAFCDANRRFLDLQRLRETLGLAALPPVEVGDDVQFSSFSSMKLHWLSVEQLSDDHLLYVTKRGSLLHHGAFLYRVLMEALRRPACREKIEYDDACRTLVTLSRERGEREEALEWIEKGREDAATHEHAFEQLLNWDLLEVMLRAEDPDDPALSQLLMHMWDHYGAKLPEVRGLLQQLAAEHGVEPPWDSEPAVVTREGAPVGSTTPGGLWTPDAAAQAAGAGKKLWVPGQD